MVSRSNERPLQPHSKEDRNLRQIKEVVECRHQIKKSGRKRKKKTQSGGGRQGERKTPDVDSSIQEQNVE